MLRNKRLALIFLLIPLWILPACTSTRGLKEAEDQGSWEQIREAGVHEDVKFNVWNKSVETIGQSGDFSPDAEKITWWATFGVNTFAMAFTPTFEAKWTGPDGKIQLARQFKKSALNDLMIKTSMPVKGEKAAEMTGDWKVEIFFKGSRIDQKKFRIVTPEMLAAEKEERLRAFQAAQTSVMTSASDAASTVSGPVGSEGEIWYREKYGVSKTQFAQGDLNGAEKTLKEILALQPYRTEAHVALASIYRKQNLIEKALAELDFVIQNPVYRDQAMALRSQMLAHQAKGGEA